MTTVMGIDPGTATIGWGVLRADWSDLEVVGYGAIRTPKEMEQPERLHTIYESIKVLLREYSPDSVAIEELFFSRNVTNAMAVSEARGVIQLAVYAHRFPDDTIPITGYKPNTIKKAVAGDGKAKKPEVQEAVRLYLGLTEKIRPDDAADALAVAITHITSNEMRG